MGMEFKDVRPEIDRIEIFIKSLEDEMANLSNQRDEERDYRKKEVLYGKEITYKCNIKQLKLFKEEIKKLNIKYNI